MTRKYRLGIAVAIPLVALAASSTVGFADTVGVSGGDDGSGAAPPTTALPALPPLPGTTAPAAPTTAAATTVPVTPTVPVAPTTPVVAPTVPGTGYVATADTTGLLTVELPSSWTDIDDRRVIAADGTLRPGIWASPDLEAFKGTFTTPGLILEAYPYSPDLRPEAAVRFDFIPKACSDGGETPYSDGVFTGTLHTWNYCDGGNTRNFVLTASPAAMDMTILLYAQTVTPEDELHINHVFETFNIVPGIGLPTETVPPPTTTTVPVAPATTAAVPAPPPTAAPATVAPATVPPVPTGPPAGG